MPRQHTSKHQRITPKTQKQPSPNEPNASSNPRIALVCDWLTTPGGAEKVLLELHRMYPDSPIYTSQYRPKKITWFTDADVRTGWLQFFPAALRKVLGPFRQLYFSHLDLSTYDLVISVTGAEAKSICTAPKEGLSSNYSTHRHKSQHICYCHVPTQYYWQLYDQYTKNPGFGPLNPFIRLCFKLLVKPLRKADYAAAQKPDQFVTISQYAADQINKYYHRKAVIIAPPVETAKFSTKSTNLSTKNRELSTENPHFSTTSPQLFHNKEVASPQSSHDQPQGVFPQYLYQSNRPDLPPQIICPRPHQYFVIACRQVTWKRIDLAIAACLQAKVPLAVIGDGPEHQHLLRLAGDSQLIRFIPWLDSSELAFYLQNAKAYLFPSLEPFGIAAVEALAAGCPVIAYADGGSQDFIIPGKNGTLFPEQTADSLADAIKDFSKHTFNPITIAQTATQFDAREFRHKIQSIVNQSLTTLNHQATDSPHSSSTKPNTSNNHSSKHHGATHA